jgi:hypothetical protein
MRFWVAILAAALCLAPAIANPIPPTPQADLDCRFAAAVADVPTLRDLPPPIESAVFRALNAGFAKTSEAIAHRGAMFNATDRPQEDLPGRRFIRAGRSGDKWFVWYEQGNGVYSKNLLVFVLGADDSARLIARASYGHENPCLLTEPFLAGPASPPAPRP